MLQEVKFDIPRIFCHLEWQDSEGNDYYTFRILPSVPGIGDTVLITTKAGPYVGTVTKHIWHFNDELETGNDYVTVKIKALPEKKSEADNG